MSNHLAIATVTAALGYRLTRDVIQPDLPGGNVTNLRPNAPSGLPSPGINVFLYQVTPNLAQRNSDTPTRRADGTLLRRPVAALDLHYMLSFYGDDAQWEPQRLLGATVRTLHAEPVLDRATINAVVTGGGIYAPLVGSDLEAALDLVRFVPTALTFEEMSKLWGIFYQMPYVLSVAYLASAVLIETDDTPTTGLPVRRFHVAGIPLEQPFIESAASSAGPRRPLTVSDQLVVTGVNLSGGVSSAVLLDGAPASTVVSATDTQIVVALPPIIVAGAHTVQVLETVVTGPPAGAPPVTPTLPVESNKAAFAVAPTITGAVTAAVSSVGGSVQVDVTIPVAPAVRSDQRVQVLLVTMPALSPSYAFDVKLPLASPPTLTTTIALSVKGPTQPIAPGTYLVRVLVDGVPSFLHSAAAPPHAYDGPTVVVP